MSVPLGALAWLLLDGGRRRLADELTRQEMQS
jgi:hypothetical protein